MVFDWIYLAFLALFLLKGYRKGLILALFSVIALISGVCVALQLSKTVAGWLFNDYPQIARWTPLISYFLVFVITVWLIRLAGGLIQQSFEFLALGWFNRILGAILYGFFISFAFSVFLWLALKMDFFKDDILLSSKAIPLLKPVFHQTLKTAGYIFPFVRSLFDDLSFFFGQVNVKLSEHVGID